MIITGTNLIQGRLDLSSLERLYESNPVERYPFRATIMAGQSIEVDDKFYTLHNIQTALAGGYITISGYSPGGGGTSDHSALTNLDYASSGHTGFLPSTHLTDFNHSDISHANRTALNNVSGVNTGDQDLSSYLQSGDNVSSLVNDAGYLTSGAGYLTEANAASIYFTQSNADAHINDLTIHFTEGSIDHLNIQNAGNNTHSQIDQDLSRLANTSGTNTGDQDLSNYLQIGDNVSSLANDAGYIITESDPVFTAWLGATPPLYSESDPLSLHLDQTTPQSVINGAPIFKGLQFDTNTFATPLPYQMGLMQWNKDELTVDINLADNSVLQVGQETLYRVKNQTGSTLTDGTAVMFAGSLGNSGLLLCQPMIGNGTYPSDYFMGIVTHDILDGEDGYVTHFGKVRNINTTGADVGETWNDGDILYLSATTAGKLTKNRPAAPNNSITACAVIHAHNNGSLFVRPTWECKLADLQDVDGTPLTTDGQILVWSNTSSVFDFNYNINDYLLEADASNTYATIVNFNNHTGDGTIHFTEGSINHNNIQNIGTNSHAQIDIDLARLANTSGTNTGDQDLSSYLQSGDNVSSLTNDAGYLVSSDLTPYAKLDGTNQPFTGDIEVSKANPKIIATDSATDTPSVWMEKLTTLDGSQIVSQNRPFVSGNALSLNGSGYASRAGVSLGTTHTIEFWLNGSSTANQVIIGDGTVFGRIVEFVNTGTQARLSTEGGASFRYWGISNIFSGTWKHVVFRRSNTTIELFINGVSQGAGTQSGGVYDTKEYTVIGALGNAGFGSKYTGLLDEVVLWNKYLSNAEIAERYNSGVGSEISDWTNVVAEYRFNSNYNDSSPNARNLSAGGSGNAFSTGLVPAGVSSLEDLPILKITNSLATDQSYGDLNFGYYLSTKGTSNIYDGLTHRFRILGTTRALLSGSTFAVTGNITASTSIGASTTLSSGTSLSVGTSAYVGTTAQIRGGTGTNDYTTIWGASGASSSLTTLALVKTADASGDWVFMGFHAGAATSPKIHFGGFNATPVTGAKVSIDTLNGRLGIKNTSPGYALDVSDGNITAVFGADTNLSTRTNNTIKISRLAFAHYANAEEPVALIISGSESGRNYMSIGGGSSLCNTMTLINFYTAANTTTLTGSLRMSIISNGNVGIGTSAPDKVLEVNSADGNNLRLTYNDSDGSATNYVDLLTTSSGDLTITPSGGDVSLGSANLGTTGAIKGVHKAADGTNAVADGTYNFYNDGTTSGQVTSFTIKDGVITAITQIP